MLVYAHVKSISDINTVNQQTQLTPLLHAARYGDSKALAVLIENGADIHAVNPAGCTGLHLAAWNGHVDCVRQLIKAGCLLDAKAVDGKTALMKAAQLGKEAAAKALVRAGADISIADARGDTALELAENGGHKACVRLIKDGKAKSSSNLEIYASHFKGVKDLSRPKRVMSVKVKRNISRALSFSSKK